MVKDTRIRGTWDKAYTFENLRISVLPKLSGISGAIERFGELATNVGLSRSRVFGRQLDIKISLCRGVEVGPIYVNDDRSDFRPISAPIGGICQEESGCLDVGGRCEDGLNPGSSVLLSDPP